ncbi:MAG: DUF2490 domain-containing protein [Flavobacteriales bacterium]|nr:DUF2490 domain-containing protein [Flavobacteriales bacterium]
MTSISKIIIALIALNLSATISYAQNEEQLGAWYMYFFNNDLEESPWGFQGDVQFRNWDLGGDLEQLLLRGGVTFRPKDTPVKFTLGVGHITSGTLGDSNETSSEFRVYQEALLPQSISEKIKLTHRFRYEQRNVEDQDLRTRYRYALFLNFALTGKKFEKGAVYLALYNELFINGQRNVADDTSVPRFDRNRSYAALGYKLSEKTKIQLGTMRQSGNSSFKDQLQLSLHHNW